MTRLPAGEVYANTVNPRQGIPPEQLRFGACMGAAGIMIMDAYRAGRRGSADSARALCRSCSVIEICGDWILRAEKPAGSWGGVYAAMTPADRAGIRFPTDAA